MRESTVEARILSDRAEGSFDPRQTVYDREPDYRKPLFKIPREYRARMFGRLCFLYGTDVAEHCLLELERILQVHHAYKPPARLETEKNLDPAERFSEQDVILITYGDLLKGSEPSPLATLARFCDHYLEGTMNTLHIRPFFPYSSDSGYSVTHFETFDTRHGN
jgi:sucrose phosphorylase